MIHIALLPEAKSDLQDLPDTVASRVRDKLDEIEGNDFRGITDYDTEKVQRYSGDVYRLRIGDRIRVLFVSYPNGIVIIAIGHRDGAYQAASAINSRLNSVGDCLSASG